jgi:hypothetical protein
VPKSVERDAATRSRQGSAWREAARDLGVLLDLKDKAQYGFLQMSVPEVRKVMRRSNRLVDFAAVVLSR